MPEGTAARKIANKFAFSLAYSYLCTVMKKIVMLLMLLMTACHVQAEPQSDPRCIHFLGVPLEGHADSLRLQLKEMAFTEWGGSEDGEDIYFRGNYYGIRAKLTVSVQPLTPLVASAYVAVGPYRSKNLLSRNLVYFKHKLQEELGELTERDGAWYYLDDFGSVKLSVVDNEDGTRDIRVLYCTTAPFYKDALCMGLRGNVQEIVTDNPLAENPVERYLENGQTDNPDLTDREYDRYGYLVRAVMAEQKGHSVIEYTYDNQYRLIRRTLTNTEAGIRYVHDYTYTEEDEILTENQKVYDKTGVCVMTLNLRNNYLTHDSNGNWTANSLSLTYWEKDGRSQQSTAMQKRTISYWDD